MKPSLVKMQAASLVFPLPSSVHESGELFRRPTQLRRLGQPIPRWLVLRFEKACRAARIRPSRRAGATLSLEIRADAFPAETDRELRLQAYELEFGKDGSIAIRSPGKSGLQYGIITLCHLLEAAAAGAVLRTGIVRDRPVFRIRGFQADLAREFYPPPAYLRKLIDRMAELKLNTLWLYLENHFRAPGMENLSPPGGLTPAQARAISAYGAQRGVDVVPATNVMSHMEGWLRLERYADLTDGAMRSYPILTHPEIWPLVRRYLDALMDAFPSRNIHVGLDELLFTGTNPEAIRAIARSGGKAAYFARFASRVARHVLARGRIPWIWDDMVMGKNVMRKEGFGKNYLKALAALPRQTVMTHWYYWTNSDGAHAPIICRVAAAKRPFVVAPSSLVFAYDGCGSWQAATENQRYLAQCGKRHGAFGYVNTHWESQLGFAFESGWPLLATGAGFAWSGHRRFDAEWERAFSFALCGDTQGRLPAFLRAADELQKALEQTGLGPAGLRGRLFSKGPQHLWRKLSPALTPVLRRRLRAHLAKACRLHQALGLRRTDPCLNAALAWPLTLIQEGLALVDAFDRSWYHYHAAALMEGIPVRRQAMAQAIRRAVREIQRAADCLRRLRTDLRFLEKVTGHAPSDGRTLEAYAKDLDGVGRLMRQTARVGIGLPYFEKLLHLPDRYHHSNLDQFQTQNSYHAWGSEKNLMAPRRPRRIV